MPLTPQRCSSAAIWQGFEHQWEYNHRLNRFGSYVRRLITENGLISAVVGHSAASGTGEDMAHFREFVTEVAGVGGVAFQTGVAETIVECQRGDLTPFVIRLKDLELNPALQNRDQYTVVLGGFDIYALEHSEKIMTLDLEVTDPTLERDGTRLRFSMLGELCFDCRSPECQLLPVRLEVERVAAGPDQESESEVPEVPEMPDLRPKRGLDRRQVDRVARWLKRQLAQLTDVEDVKQSVVGEQGDILRRRLFSLFGRRFFLKFLNWRLSAPYVIRVHYLIIAGDEEAFSVTESADFEHAYAWDMEHEIHQEEVGTLPVQVSGQDPRAYAVNTLAFRHIFLDVAIDETHGSDDPIQWGKGMHFLEWCTAIRDIQPYDDGVTATLDLFYKNWSDAMNEVITLTTWGAVRAGGHARMGARLALLQFREAASSQQRALPGRIYWPGRGLSAQHDPRARFERRISLGPREKAPSVTSAVSKAQTAGRRET